MTLIEVMAVLVILSLAAGWAMGTLAPGIDRMALVRDVGRLAATMRAARLAALADHRESTVAVEPALRRYRRDGAAAVTVADGIAVAIAGPADGILRFHPDGSADGGTVRLSDGTRGFLVRNHWPSGRVSIEPATSP